MPTCLSLTSLTHLQETKRTGLAKLKAARAAEAQQAASIAKYKSIVASQAELTAELHTLEKEKQLAVSDLNAVDVSVATAEGEHLTDVKFEEAVEGMLHLYDEQERLEHLVLTLSDQIQKVI